MVDAITGPDDWQSRQHEVLREASVALRGQPITLWEISDDGGAVAVLGTAPEAPRLDLDATLRRWSAPLAPGRRWVGSLLTEGRWCLAPVRTAPPQPPPGGTERRSRERMVLELAGLSIGLLDQTRLAKQRRPPEAATRDLARHPSVIAHEVGNPLASALAYAELGIEALKAGGDLGPRERAELLDALTAVEEGIRRAVDFLRSLQMEARLPTGQMDRFNLVDLARSCVTLEKPLAAKQGVVLEFTPSVGEAYLVGDGNALFRALVNLIRNAVAATSPGGAAAPVRVELSQARDEVRLTVRDRGRGIAPENLEAIFEPGFTTEGHRGGTGMGLTVVKEVTDRFGGRVEVQTRLGQGSVFMLALPLPAQRSAPS
jgi:signal transduction histidine kinase